MKLSEKPTSLLSASELKTAKGKAIYWSFFVILIGVALCSLIPLVWTLLTAFKDTQEIYTEFSFFPKDMSWNRIVTRVSESWKILQLGEAFITTIFMGIGSCIFRLFVCGLGGYALSKLKPKGHKLIFVLITWTMMMPGQIRIVPNFMTNLHFPFAMDFGAGVSLLDTLWPIWFSAGADSYAILLFKNTFDGLSTGYVEAAKIDGASDIKIFSKIMLPLSLPMVIYQLIGVFSAVWSNFFAPLIYFSNITVVPLEIFRLKTETSIQMNTYFMALIFASIPPFLIFAIFHKRIMGGATDGGEKG